MKTTIKPAADKTKFVWYHSGTSKAQDESDTETFKRQGVPFSCFTATLHQSCYLAYTGSVRTMSTSWVKNKTPEVNVRDRNYRNEEKFHLH